METWVTALLNEKLGRVARVHDRSVFQLCILLGDMGIVPGWALQGEIVRMKHPNAAVMICVLGCGS